MDVVVQLSRLEAMSSPAYLLAQAINDPTSCRCDPVKEALSILEAVGENEGRFKTFSYRFDQVSKDLEELIVALLDCCSDQVCV